ncbi:hypothetical protein PG326_00010 [Riemerella anatipestifer]|nr:hypothetical protein [Riemerella anatipestifer]MDY3356720.1 hypothetical protein [Riemerella anatipestifer]
MNYIELEKKYTEFFIENFEKYMSELILEVRKEKFPIDYSKYTMKTVKKVKLITEHFMIEQKIENHTITNSDKSFELDYCLYLEMFIHKKRVELESALFIEILNKNVELIK